MRGGRAAPAPTAATSTGALGFDSLFGLLAWIGALILLLIAPTQIAGYWPGDYNFWPQSLFSLLLAGVALLLGIARLPHIRFDGVALCLSLFLGWCLLAVFTGTYAHDAWLELGRVTLALAFFWIMRAFPRPAQKLGLIAAAVVGVAAVGGPALLNFVATRDPRQFGTFFNPNIFANALALALPLSIGLPLAIWNLTRNRNFAIVGALPFFVLLPALAVTSSKGGLLAAFVGCLVAVFALRASRPAAFKTAFRRALPAVLILGLVFGALAAKTVGPRLLAARGADNNSTMFRTYLWRGTLRMIAARPIVGFGPGAFSGSFPRYALADTARSSEQSWLQIAAESGVPALLFLLGAFVLAFRNGWKSRSEEGWALRAAAMGALAAMIVHGCVDSGWNATPIVILLALALGVLQTPSDPSVDAATPRGNLNLGWIGATLLLALAGFGAQQAAQGQNYYEESLRLAKLGSRAQALQLAGQAVDVAPGSSRFWSNLGYLQSATGADGDAALQRSIELQSDRAANYLTRARVAQANNRPDLYEKWMALALERQPNSSYFLLSRAQFRLEHKDGRGYDDLEALMRLWDAPYGLYPALADQVNLDFARGVALLAPRLNQTGQSARARKLVERALKDVARAIEIAPRNREMAAAVGGGSALDLYEDAPDLKAALGTDFEKLEVGSWKSEFLTHLTHSCYGSGGLRAAERG